MAEYLKINTLFKRDEKNVIIPSEYTLKEFEYLNKFFIMKYLIIFSMALLLFSCSNATNAESQNEVYTVEETETNTEYNPEQYNILVEQVVDLWMFNNLNDYKSYRKLIPSIKFISAEDNTFNYEYEIKYAATNKMGGTETNILIFKVALNNPFNEDNYMNNDFSYKIENITPESLLNNNGTLN